MDALGSGALALCLLSVAWTGSTILAALVRPWTRRRGARWVSLPPVSVVVPVSAPAPGLAACVASLARLDYPDHEVLLCAASDDGAAVRAIVAMRRKHPSIRTCVVAPVPLDNPKSGLLAVAVREARHDLLLLTDDNVVSAATRIQDHLAHRDAGHGLVSAAALGESSENLWAAVDEAFMNGRFARLQLAGDAIGLTFTTGKSILVSRAALDASGGYAAAGDTLCEDAIVQQGLAAIGVRAALGDAPVRQPLGRRTLAEVWHRHLRWAGCRKRHVPLLFAAELVVSAPVAAIAGGIAAASLGAGFVIGAAGTAGALMAMEWAFLALARWPLDGRFPAAWLVREALSLALWFAALAPRRRVVWRDQTFVAGARLHPNRRASKRTD